MGNWRHLTALYKPAVLVIHMRSYLLPRKSFEFLNNKYKQLQAELNY